jgi:hypothetical protein
MVELNIMTVVALAAGILALIDGIIRLRGRGTAILAIIEIIVAVLFLIAFIPPLAAVISIDIALRTLAIVLLIVLVLQLILRGSTRRGSVAITIVSLVLLAFWLVVNLGWITIPGIT